MSVQPQAESQEQEAGCRIGSCREKGFVLVRPKCESGDHSVVISDLCDRFQVGITVVPSCIREAARGFDIAIPKLYFEY